MTEIDQENLLTGRRIAVPESRELNLFSAMLESRGAEVLRCPLVSIRDSPEKETVEAWIREFAGGDFDDIILLTGEGLRRLLGFAERAGGGLRDDFVAALGATRKITRGPKPGNALRQIGLKSDLSAAQPTTEGVIESLAPEHLAGRRMAVQLYGTDPNRRLVDFLQGQGARVSTVAPYIYADDAEDRQVEILIGTLCEGRLDAIAFTSTPQVSRLFRVAARLEFTGELTDALNGVQVAAVGPVVARALEERGVAVTIMPDSTYFMKPLVRRLVAAFNL